ncbi:metallophosphoesterase [Oceanobacillus piezotolerans]|uniref:Metallophosphoesterase n=1 Tax=Oceanobacillus piezotolerans TaxID=2448030 RepID=A0A498DBB7_9BACI|nr:metallophosphoesterase [Oceanobacillus piezotolerans]
MKNKVRIRSILLLGGLLLFIVYFYFQNNSLVTSEFSVHSDRLPKSFHGYTIVQLSDLHSKSFGEEQVRLVHKVESQQPDLIVFTGDLIDSKSDEEDMEHSLILMEELVQIAPVYYVTGNHEWRSGRFQLLEENLKDIGVHVIRNTISEIAVGKDVIHLIGIDDPVNKEEVNTDKAQAEVNIQRAIENVEKEASFRILLSHRPELFPLYKEYEFDVVFSGHAHGGQFRIPFFGGIIAPNQGLLPFYTSGSYHHENTTMIVNRGLGNSIIPIRIFNRPEVMVVKLLAKENGR